MLGAESVMMLVSDGAIMIIRVVYLVWCFAFAFDFADDLASCHEERFRRFTIRNYTSNVPFDVNTWVRRNISFAWDYHYRNSFRSQPMAVYHAGLLVIGKAAP